MKFTKKFAALILAGVVSFSGFSASALSAPGLTIKENTAKFEVAMKRSVWGQNLSYEGHQGTITITNKDVAPLTNWTLEFEYNGEIKSVSNAVLTSRVGNTYVISAPTSWNRTIAPGKSLTIEFQGKKTNNDADINNIYLGSKEKAVKVTTISSWELKQAYAKNDLVSHNGLVYKCRTPHTAHAFNWTPNLTPALWGKANLTIAKPYDVLIQK